MTALPRAPVIGSRWEFVDRHHGIVGRVVYELTAIAPDCEPVPEPARCCDNGDHVMTVVEASGSYAKGRVIGDTMRVERAWFEHRTDARRIA